MNKFLAAYIECALWSSVDDDDRPLDEVDAEIAPETLEKMTQDCKDFLHLVGNLADEWSAEQAGHDFWLTRNRHGAGFWDRGFVNGQELTDAAHSFGTVHLYVGDDGLIYQG